MKHIRRFNEWLAVKGTAAFGSMGMTWAFFLYGFLPIIFPALMVTLLYWSNTVQLWSLPLLMVGQNIASRKINALIEDTHKVVLDEMAMIRDDHATLTSLVKELHSKESA